jgi:glyoxylase-like metal-dependent hydrolase (beta-lactamase superfamily II)
MEDTMRTFRNLLVGLAAVTVAAVSLNARQAAVPAPLVRENALVKLGEHTWAIPDNDTPQVPNVGIVVGNRATLVIDPGLGRRNGETVLRELGRVSKNQEIYVAATHFHVEHTTGNLGFPASARYVSSTIQDAEFVEGAAAQAKTFGARSLLHAELLKDVSQRKTDVAFDREHMLDLGGLRVQLLVVGPTHTRGDTVFFVEGDNVLFAGDVVMNNSFVAANQNSSMKAWLAAFDRLEQWKPKTIVPAHGAIGPGTLIATNRTFMRAIHDRARQLKAEGRSADETAAIVQKEMEAKHPGFARVNGVAGAARAAHREAQ